MAWGKGVPSSEKAVMRMKYFLYFFNVVQFFVAAAIVAMGLWMRYEWEFKQYILQLGMQQFWTGAYILIVTGSFVMFFSLIGCWGAIAENPNVLGLYGIFLVVSFILELAGVATILNNGTLWSPATWWLRDRFYQLIYNMDTNAKEARILRIIQEQVGCCGSYSSLDYINVNKPVPVECRDKATGNEYLDGCYIRFSRELEKRSGWISGVTLFLAVFQILGVLVIITLRSTIKKLDKEGKTYDPVKKSRA